MKFLKLLISFIIIIFFLNIMPSEISYDAGFIGVSILCAAWIAGKED